MNSSFMPLGPFIAVFFIASVAVAFKVYRAPGDAPAAERGLLASACVLVGLSPVVWLLVGWLAGETSVFTGGIQLIVAAALAGAAGLGRHRRRQVPVVVSRWHFNEKSAFIIILSLLVVCATFARRAWGGEDAVVLASFGRAIVELVVFVVIGHIIAALTHAPIDAADAKPDERDRAVTLLSARNAYYLLFAGFVSLPFYAVFQPSVVGFVVTWTGVLVLSELVYYGSVLTYYRLGTE
ncbi:MAG: hypothetical protein AAFY69_01350 [Pseudomonadota bacterium]